MTYTDTIVTQRPKTSNHQSISVSEALVAASKCKNMFSVCENQDHYIAT